MNCTDCYKNGHCWACVKWFGCSKPEKTEGCFICGKENCPKLQKGNEHGE